MNSNQTCKTLLKNYKKICKITDILRYLPGDTFYKDWLKITKNLLDNSNNSPYDVPEIVQEIKKSIEIYDTIIMQFSTFDKDNDNDIKTNINQCYTKRIEYIKHCIQNPDKQHQYEIDHLKQKEDLINTIILAKQYINNKIKKVKDLLCKRDAIDDEKRRLEDEKRRLEDEKRRLEDEKINNLERMVSLKENNEKFDKINKGIKDYKTHINNINRKIKEKKQEYYDFQFNNIMFSKEELEEFKIRKTYRHLAKKYKAYYDNKQSKYKQKSTSLKKMSIKKSSGKKKNTKK